MSVALGVLMAVVAEGGVLAIGIPVWGEYFMAAPPDDAVVVEVTGTQFVWHARYPGPDGEFGRLRPELIDQTRNPLGLDGSDPRAADDIVFPGEVYAPVNRPIVIRLRSTDVIHSFFVPSLRVKQDAVPGMMPEILVVPTKEGSFDIACAELCGLATIGCRVSSTSCPRPDSSAGCASRNRRCPSRRACCNGTCSAPTTR